MKNTNKTLNIQVLRGKNSSVGNPSFIIKSFWELDLFHELVDKGYFKRYNNKKDGKGFKTKPNASFSYDLLNKKGVEIDGILVKATLFIED